MLSVSRDGNRVQLSTGQSIDPKLWSKKKQRKKSYASAAFRINQFLIGLKEKLNNYYYTGKAENKIITKIDMKDTIYNYLDPEPPKEKSKLKK